MDLSVEEFVDKLLTKEALQAPSDKVNPDELVLELPPWFDEKKFNQGRRFFWDHCYTLSTSMLLGLVAVLAVPSILRVLIGTRRSNSVYTSYKRYLSTLLHTVSWFEHELKPGTISWNSLYAVRSRHLRAGLASKLKGGDVVSQRDIALTQYGFIGFSVLKPDLLGIRQLQEGDWEAYNHLWRTIGYMIGLEDRYNICRKNIEETRAVCQLLQDRVFTPCLENVPEYFEHMARVMLDGMWSVNPSIEVDSLIFVTRYLSDVPGYMLRESERIDFQRKLVKHMKGRPEGFVSGLDSRELMCKPAVEGLPEREPRLLYLHDYECVDTVPEYRRLGFFSKLNITLGTLAMNAYNTYLGRMYFNLHFKVTLFFMKYFPYGAFLRFGFKASFVNMFAEDPMDDTKPRTNEEYYNKPSKMPWYISWLTTFW